MPRTAPAVKKRAVEGYGGRVVECEPTLAARNDAAARIQVETGAVMIHPYDHPDVMAGQGTLALELLEQVGQVDTIVVPVSGGGLISGITVAAKATLLGVRIIGVEPAGADDAARSKAAGVRTTVDEPRSIADGLLASLGELTWPIIRDQVDGIVTVTEDQIIAATRLLWERQKIVVEPSGAVPLAAALNHALPGQRIGLILSGGNVDLDHLPWVTPRG
jgi:threonine dehydratase/serine racemase